MAKKARIVLDVRDLRIAFGRGAYRREVVHGISFSVASGEILAIVGESGSGKTVIALSLMGLLPKGSAHITGGQAIFEKRDLFTLQANELNRIRGEKIGMVFQEPMTSLNPVLSIGRQLTEGLMAHGSCGLSEARERAATMLERVGIDRPIHRLSQYPHEFSGGMRQRVMIAMAMIMKPALLIADEPTTALDVTIQAQILDLMQDLVVETGTSLLLITHDMGVVAETADRVVVMKGGNTVEQATVRKLFSNPRAPYTQALLAAVPRINGEIPTQRIVSSSLPILGVSSVSKIFGGKSTFFGFKQQTKALDRVSLEVMQGETLALVGESGSGKSTLGRAIARLVEIDEGAIMVDGEDITKVNGRRLKRSRSKVQLIFQDPYASLDPRFSIGRTVAEPIMIHGLANAAEAKERAAHLLKRVGLEPEHFGRYPHEFSGGQRQRIAIARALAVHPRLIIADEPTSSLDVSIQAQILDLLAELRDEHRVAFLFISHDLAVVRKISSRIAVMRAGRILELGPTKEVLESPLHAYTQALIAAVPIPEPGSRRQRGQRMALEPTPHHELNELCSGHWVAS